MVAAACFLVIGQGLKRVVDAGFAQGDPAALNQALFALLAVIVVMSASVWARFYLVSWLGERVVADLRRDVFAHLLELSPAFFEQARTGEVISRLTTDSALLEQVVGTSVSMAVRNALLGIGSLVMLALTSFKLTALVLLMVPVVVAPIALFGRRVRKLSRASQDRIADLGSYLDETLHEIRTVQAYGHEPADRRLFGERVEAAFATARSRIRQRATLVALVILLVFGGIGVILWIGGHDVLAGRLTAGELSAFVFYAAMVAAAAGAISEVIGDLQRGAGAAERLGEILGTRAGDRGAGTAAAAARSAAGPHRVGRGDVLLSRTAGPSRRSIASLSTSSRVRSSPWSARRGPANPRCSSFCYASTIQAQGRSGWTAWISAWPTPAAVRGRIALVPQEPAIFAASVRENVRYARPDADDEAVRRACDAAFAMEFVRMLPGGLDAFLGERGVRLSGGQRQRLAIARAILSDRPVLLLDEATSALDSESERIVQAALERLMRGRTTLIIAHRLATVKSVDRIAVIDQGRLVGLGRHDELLLSEPLYARLAALQFGALESK